MSSIATNFQGLAEIHVPPASVETLQLRPHEPVGQLCGLESNRLKFELMSSEQLRDSFVSAMQKEARTDVADFYGRPPDEVTDDLISTYTTFEYENGKRAENVFRGREEIQALKKLPFIIKGKSDNLIRGLVILHSHSSGDPQVGMYLLAAHRRQGYGTESIEAFINYVRHNLVAGELLWRCSETNSASCQFVESLGWKRVSHSGSHEKGSLVTYTIAL